MNQRNYALVTLAYWGFTLTDGASLTANVALVRNNARLAAAIAREIGSQAE